jgi:hypothetical protein
MATVDSAYLATLIRPVFADQRLGLDVVRNPEQRGLAIQPRRVTRTESVARRAVGHDGVIVKQLPGRAVPSLRLRLPDGWWPVRRGEPVWAGAVDAAG